MRNLFISIILIFILAAPVSAQAQTSRWFVTASSGVIFGGPGSSIKKNMKNNGFDLGRASGIYQGSEKYPNVSQRLRILVMVGKRVRPKGTVYALGGLSGNASITGYNGTDKLTIKYSVLQFGAGYQFSFSQTTFKLGVGPSLFALKYSPQHSGDDEETAFRPGLSVVGRWPFGKEKNLFGVEIFIQLNAAPSVDMKEFQIRNSTLKADKASMLHGVLGLSFAFRE